MKKQLGVLAVGTVLALGAAFAQDDIVGMGFGDFDADTNAQVDMTEFGTAFNTGGLHNRFDADTSGGVDETEFNQGIFSTLDTDISSSLSEEEITAGAGLLGDTDINFTDLDADASGDVSVDEFSQGFDSASDFGTFDADASGDISQTEFNEGVFGRVDANADGMITEDEFTPNERLFQNFNEDASTGG